MKIILKQQSFKNETERLRLRDWDTETESLRRREFHLCDSVTEWQIRSLRCICIYKIKMNHENNGLLSLLPVNRLQRRTLSVNFFQHTNRANRETCMEGGKHTPGWHKIFHFVGNSSFNQYFARDSMIHGLAAALEVLLLYVTRNHFCQRRSLLIIKGEYFMQQ